MNSDFTWTLWDVSLCDEHEENKLKQIPSGRAHPTRRLLRKPAENEKARGYGDFVSRSSVLLLFSFCGLTAYPPVRVPQGKVAASPVTCAVMLMFSKVSRNTQWGHAVFWRLFSLLHMPYCNGSTCITFFPVVVLGISGAAFRCQLSWQLFRILLLFIVRCHSGMLWSVPYNSIYNNKNTCNRDSPGGDTTKLIAAWGNEDTVSYHGIDNVAQGQEYLFADVGDSGVAPLAEIMSDDTVSYFDVTAVCSVSWNVLRHSFRPGVAKSHVCRNNVLIKNQEVTK